jgi:hypothetical protein
VLNYFASTGIRIFVVQLAKLKEAIFSNITKPKEIFLAKKWILIFY